MNSSWQAFLHTQQMLIDESGTSQYHRQQPFIAPGCGSLIALDCLCTLRLSGARVLTALQGQITQDIKRLTPQTPVLTDLCTPKGRIIATALLLLTPEQEVLLLADKAQAKALEQHLHKYLMFDRVQVSIEHEQIVLCQLGDEAVQDIESTYPLPLAENACLLLCTQAEAERHWKATNLLKGGQRAWLSLLMQCGLFWVGQEHSEQFTPHHLNHPTLGLVSFNKGCYTGQEIIARMQYKAQLKQCLCLLSGDQQLTPGPITNAEGEARGQLIWGHPLSADQWLYFAQIDRAALDGEAQWQSGGEILRLAAPPML